MYKSDKTEKSVQRSVVCGTGLTRLQVAELGQRPHLQVLQVERIRLPAGQIPHNMFVDHTHTPEPHESTKQQRHLKDITSH